MAGISVTLDAMGGDGEPAARREIARMQAGMRAWVLRAASGGVRGLRGISPPVLLSLLCASAFSPLIAVGAGVTGAVAVAGVSVLSSVSGGALSGVIAGALDRARPRGGRRIPSAADVEDE